MPSEARPKNKLRKIKLEKLSWKKDEKTRAKK
jgi:hypothetical protein